MCIEKLPETSNGKPIEPLPTDTIFKRPALIEGTTIGNEHETFAVVAIDGHFVQFFQKNDDAGEANLAKREALCVRPQYVTMIKTNETPCGMLTQIGIESSAGETERWAKITATPSVVYDAIKMAIERQRRAQIMAYADLQPSTPMTVEQQARIVARAQAEEIGKVINCAEGEGWKNGKNEDDSAN